MRGWPLQDGTIKRKNKANIQNARIEEARALATRMGGHAYVRACGAGVSEQGGQVRHYRDVHVLHRGAEGRACVPFANV